jgi:DNA processing protein
LEKPKISLVGSREIRQENRDFAWEVGRQAALQGYALVSGNARGADKIAQSAALRHGGTVISVVADALSEKAERENVLFLSEEDYDQPFSTQRALRRNRVIHALGEVTLVAQSDLGIGGTWSGTTANLKAGWSSVYCFDDGSDAARELEQMGAILITADGLQDLHILRTIAQNLFDQ